MGVRRKPSLDSLQGNSSNPITKPSHLSRIKSTFRPGESGESGDIGGGGGGGGGGSSGGSGGGHGLAVVLVVFVEVMGMISCSRSYS